MFHIVLKTAIHVNIGDSELGEAFDMFMLSAGGENNDSGNIHTDQILQYLFFFFQAVFRIA